MTVKVSKIKTKIEAVEMTGERIEVKLDHGATLVDCDVPGESGNASVDFFIKPFDPAGSPDNRHVIVRGDADSNRQERFFADALRWGPVRDRLAELTELQEAQQMFNLGHSLAQRVVREFSDEVLKGKVSQVGQGAMNFVKVSYQNHRGEEMTCTAYYSVCTKPGEARRLVSFTIDDRVGRETVRIEVSDPKTLNRLRAKLEPVIQKAPK